MSDTTTTVANGRGKEINKWIAALLCFFLGGIGVLVDFIVILTKPNPYYV